MARLGQASTYTGSEGAGSSTATPAPPSPVYVPGPPVPGPVTPPPAPMPVSQVPVLPAPSFRTIAPATTTVRGSYADAAARLRAVRVQASIDSRADLATLQARLRELMASHSNAKQLRSRQAGAVDRATDKDLQQAIKLAEKEMKELEKKISKARSLDASASTSSSAVENGNRAMRGALDLFEHRYDTAGEEPVAPFGGPAVSLESAHTAAEWVDQNWRQQKIQVRDSFGVKRLLTAEEIMNNPDIRMSNSQVKALAREKAEAEWDVRHARNIPSAGPASGPVAGGLFVEALTALQQVAQTARVAPTVNEAEDYAVAQETSVPTIEEAEARMPFSPYISRGATAFEVAPSSMIPSIPVFPGVVAAPVPAVPSSTVEKKVNEGIKKDFADWKIPEVKDLGINEYTTSESATSAQYREMKNVLGWISHVIKVGQAKGAKAAQADATMIGQIKQEIGNTIKQRYGDAMYRGVLRAMDSGIPMGARYAAARSVADTLRKMEEDSRQLALSHPTVQAAVSVEQGLVRAREAAAAGSDWLEAAKSKMASFDFGVRLNK